ncbi:EAL domain-containing protein [Chthonobacter rhizosphaerae]|uniref:EAL domain-containing protein n=1 Tax=Chthonobacter rhizosphaerae TaxID=2735553 RepID=UPI0015EE9DD6
MVSIAHIRLVRQNYALAIAILVALAIASATLMHWALKVQSANVELSLLSSRQAQAFASLKSATGVFIQAVEHPSTVEDQLVEIRQRLETEARELDSINIEIRTFLAARKGLFQSGISQTVLDIYEERPHRLSHWLEVVVWRMKGLAKLNLTEARYFLRNWSSVDVAFLSEKGLSRSFGILLAEIEKTSRDLVVQLRTAQFVLTLTTLLVLLGEVALIFGPMVRSLREEHARAEEKTKELNRLAFTDGLTGLANRTAFRRALEDACRSQSDGSFALILCDLDRFKAVNDGFGHAAGDALLQEMARRISSVVRPDDFTARLGGDEFAVLAAGLKQEADLTHMIAAIRSATAKPWRWGDVEIDVSSAVGGALCATPGEDPDRLLAYADLALYDAKSGDYHLKVFDKGLKDERDREAAILRELSGALANGEFELHYQPKVRVRDGAVVGVEALVRWRHPERGLLQPGAFLGAVQRGGRMVDLTRALIETAGRDMASWRRKGLPIDHVAVNMPESMLSSRICLPVVASMLARHGLPGSVLAVEITEDVLLSRAADTIAGVVNDLSALGVQIAFDDFGTGFASLSHLRSFTFDQVKIDRSFISEIGTGTASQEIVRSISSLARALGKDVVAEGVETEAQLAFLAAEGCGIVQGFLFSGALPRADLEAWVLRHEAQRHASQVGAVQKVASG